MPKNEPIHLFWWSEKKFASRQQENYGDLLSKYLVEKVSGKTVKWVHPKKMPWYRWDKTHYLGIGSILAHATKNSIVWGSGIIDTKHPVAAADFRAVRGPHTRKFLLNLGYHCPEVYGDPALLLPEFYNLKIDKQYKVGIVPHYVDYLQVKEWYSDDDGVKVIDLLTNNVEATTREILSCEQIISSSLHGIIVAHAYSIPAVWVKFSNKIFGDDIKYADYFESVGLKPYNPKELSGNSEMEELQELFKNPGLLPEENKIKDLCKGLINACPFLT